LPGAFYCWDEIGLQFTHQEACVTQPTNSSFTNAARELVTGICFDLYKYSMIHVS